MIDIKDKAKRIHGKLKRCGCQQARYHHGRVLTYCYPAPRGYGVRGVLVAIYTAATELEWIEDDLVSLNNGENIAIAG